MAKKKRDWQMVTMVRQNHAPRYLWLYVALAGFVGYGLGRLGHVFLGQTNGFLHHWIYGLLIMLVSPFFRRHWIYLVILSFGAGMFVSDFDDFLAGKIIGRDTEPVAHFWGID